MMPQGNNNLNFRLARDQVVHFWNHGKFVCQPRQANIFFTQSWQLNGFKQELKKKLSSRENMTFQRSLNIYDLINSYVFVTYFMCKLRYWDL